MAQIKLTSTNIYHDNAAAYGVNKSIMKGSATETIALFGYELLDDSFSFTGFEQTVKNNPGIVPAVPVAPAVIYDGDGAYIRAKRWLRDVSVEFDTGLVTYTGKTIVGMIASMSKHNGGLYIGDKTAGDVIAEIFDGVPSLTYSVSADVAAIPLYGRLKRASRRDNLAEILIATGAALTYDADGNILICFLQVPPFQKVKNVYLGSVSIENAETYKNVSVTEHGFYELPTDETRTLFDNTDSLTPASSVLVEFQEPCYDLQTTGTLTIDQIGGVDDANCNYAVVSGQGTLTGKVYTHTTREVIKAVSNGSTKVRTMSDVQLVTMVNSQYVAERMANFYKQKTRVRLDCVLDENIKPGKRILFEKSGSLLVSYTGYIESISYNLNPRKTRATVKMLQNWTPGPFGSNITTYEILTGSGTWSKPANLVGDVTAILIGGGQGGTGGQGGQGGTGSDNQTTSAGGTGGAVGAGGSAGKVLQVTFTPGASYSYSTGAGGAGGSGGAGGAGGAKGHEGIGTHIPAQAGAAGALGTAGTAGGNTTFGSYSSANGSVPVSGVQNILTGDVYALNGAAGTYAGGDGGSSGDPAYATAAQAGASVAGYAGGSPGTNAQKTTGTIRGAGGGGGGGAAYVNNGANGQNGVIDGAFNENPGKGGDGADALLLETVGTYGQGGAGGNGGGAGAGSGATYSQDGRGYDGGNGGKGSDGQDGFDGAVVLLYTINSQA